MTEKLAVIGLCSCIYAVARLLHYVSLRLQDDPHGSVLSPLLSFACIALWLLSLPVTIVFYFLNKLHIDRLCEIIRKEGIQEGRRLAELDRPPAPPQAKILKPSSPIFRDLAVKTLSQYRRFLREEELPVVPEALLYLSIATLHCCPAFHAHQMIRKCLLAEIIAELCSKPSSPSQYTDLAGDYLSFLTDVYGYDCSEETRIKSMASAMTRAFGDIEHPLERKKQAVYISWTITRYIVDVFDGASISIN